MRELTRTRSDGRGRLGTVDARKFWEACGRMHEAIELFGMARINAGRELDMIKEEGLYIEVADTFEEFVKMEFGLSKSRAYQCIEAWKVHQAMSTIVDVEPPKNEAICRELAVLESEQEQADVWQAVHDVCETQGKQPTAGLVKRVREELYPSVDGKVEYEVCPTCGRRRKVEG